MRINHTAVSLAIAAWALLLLGVSAVVRGGTFVCNANCLSKAASVAAIAVHGKELIAGCKKGASKIAHPKRKAKRT